MKQGERLEVGGEVLTALVSKPLVEAPATEQANQDERTLAAAAALFLENGIAAAKMDDIAKAAGIGVATLYRRSSKVILAIDAATLLWQRFDERTQELTGSAEYQNLSGLDQLQGLYHAYASFYIAQTGFVSFTDELDRMIITEHVAAADLETYNAQVNAFYRFFEAAYTKGLADGSIKHKVNFEVFYRATAHAMMGVAAKLARGEVLPTDDFSGGREELDCLADMALFRLGAGTGASAGTHNGTN